MDIDDAHLAIAQQKRCFVASSLGRGGIAVHDSVCYDRSVPARKHGDQWGQVSSFGRAEQHRREREEGAAVVGEDTCAVAVG